MSPAESFSPGRGLGPEPARPMQFALALTAVLGLAVALYWPGLQGPFLFDDFATLPALGSQGGVHDLRSLLVYLTGGTAGEAGRPLSLLSFLVDDNGWPSSPASFKRTNLALHMVNGLLLAWLIHAIAEARGEPRPERIALFAMAAWLLHPLLVSTTLYVVQRMAMLAATFVLLGLLLYVKGRVAWAHARGRAHALLASATVVCPLLAVLAKENGALLPLLCLVLEATVLARLRPRPGAVWYGVFQVLPVTLMVAVVFWQWPAIVQGYELRPFDLRERLLTQAVVLTSYLYQLVIPYPMPGGLFRDDFTLSTGLTSPWWTLPCVVAVAALAVLALFLRRRQPWLACGLSFFFAAHLVESSVIPLELYFEHRNYLPAALLFVAPVVAVLRPGAGSRVRRLALGGWLAMACLGTWQQARLWGDDSLLLATWAHARPGSERAQRGLATQLEQRGQSDEALAVLAAARARQPQSVGLALHQAWLRCRLGALDDAAVRTLAGLLNGSGFDPRDFEVLGLVLETVSAGQCPGLAPPAADRLLQALDDNPASARAEVGWRLEHLRGELLLARGAPEAAAEAFARCQALLPDAEAGLQQVSLLAGRGHFALALEHLDRVDEALARPARGPLQRLRQWARDYPGESARLRRELEADLAGATHGAAPRGS